MSNAAISTNRRFERHQMQNAVFLIVYILSGILTPTVLEYIKKQGAANPSALLFAIPNSLAMACVLLVPQKESKTFFFKRFWKQIILMTVIDVAGTTLTLYGQILCGSGVYIVIYSSLTIWSALGSRVLMKKHFSLLQILGIVVVTAGLAISGVASFTSGGSSLVVGAIITLIGTIFHSAVYWLNEFMNHKWKLHMQIMCGYTGLGGLCLYAVYECAYTIPNWAKAVVKPVDDKNGVLYVILLLYAALVAVDVTHMWAQYTVVPRVGSVSLGIAKSISSTAVFVLSHILFCGGNKNQCINVFKGVSLGVVLFGVMTYVVGTIKRVAKPKQPIQMKEKTNKLNEFTERDSATISFTYNEQQEAGQRAHLPSRISRADVVELDMQQELGIPAVLNERQRAQ